MWPCHRVEQRALEVGQARLGLARLAQGEPKERVLVLRTTPLGEPELIVERVHQAPREPRATAVLPESPSKVAVTAQALDVDVQRRGNLASIYHVAHEVFEEREVSRPYGS